MVTFDLCTELGHCWVIAITAFFLIWGYFSTHQVVFRPWGLQNTKNAFYKKMLCDQASDEIILKSLPTTSHVPPILLPRNRPVVNGQGQDQPCRPLAIALGFPPYPTLRGGPVYRSTRGRVFTGVFDGRPTRS